jgi:hypothetical protein
VLLLVSIPPVVVGQQKKPGIQRPAPNPPAAQNPKLKPEAARAAIQALRPAGNFGADLVGWWKLDERTGTIAHDASGLAYDGTLAGAVAFGSDALLGQAADFTGPDGRIAVPHTADLEPEKGTIEAWIKVAQLDNWDVVAKTTDCRVRTDPSCATPTGISVIGLRIQADGGVNAFVANDDPSTPGAPWRFAQSGPGLIVPGTWHHLAMRWDGSEIAVFVDGVERDAEPYDPVPGSGLSYHNGSPFYLGVATAWAVRGSHEFIGQIDDVRYYARARPDVEIHADFVTQGQKPAKPGGP